MICFMQIFVTHSSVYASPRSKIGSFKKNVGEGKYFFFVLVKKKIELVLSFGCSMTVFLLLCCCVCFFFCLFFLFRHCYHGGQYYEIVFICLISVGIVCLSVRFLLCTYPVCTILISHLRTLYVCMYVLS